LAWLHTVPNKAEKTRQKTLEEADSELLQLPQIYFGTWLIEALFEIGPAEITGAGGMQTIKQSEIAAYSHNHGITFASWEVSALRGMSEAYAVSRSTSTDKYAAPPYTEYEPPTVERRAKVDDIFRGLLARQTTKGLG
jgi:hypothetical protein